MFIARLNNDHDHDLEEEGELVIRDFLFLFVVVAVINVVDVVAFFFKGVIIFFAETT